MSTLFVLAVIAAALSAAATPVVKRIALKLDVIDLPKGKRKIHKKPIPLLGGLAIYFSFILVMLLKNGMLTTHETGIMIGATIIVIGGVIDDTIELRPRYKLIFQISAAVVLIIFGVEISSVTNPLTNGDGYWNVGWMTVPLTILWVIGITNALNLIDGLDGLAAGVALISSITIFIIAILNNRADAAVLTAILSGAILGFLPYNFNPAKIFMGDTGAQLLGFLLAAISIEGTIKSAAAFAIAVPILALGIPIYDTLFAVIRRKINGKPIMQADRGHLHHRLMDMGLTQRQAVLIMYLISAMLGSIAIIAMQISNQRAYFILALVMVLLVLVAWKCGFFKSRD